MPLPDLGGTAEKDERGSVVVCGGTRETPGGVLLAGVAALRVGAGRVQLGADRSVVTHLAVAVPEAFVAPLDEIGDAIGDADAVLVGPGTGAPDQIGDVLSVAAERLGARATLVVDAGALAALAKEPELIADVRGRTILMPNPKEMAVLLDRDVDQVLADPRGALASAIDRFGATVTLRGADTLTAAPGQPCYLDQSGCAGLGTGGSGDVLAGAIAGLAARGADPLTATVWANHLHGVAGQRCSARIGPVGFLARELLDELPAAVLALK
jgi:hydroxyethylthiazole kinase-like uncharacterized protein yjeF